jgi:hypothetical protein
MKNLQQMMKQAQEMQSKMAEMQERMADMEVEGTAGAGMVKAVLNGKGEVRSLKIDPKLVDPNDVEMMEDLIVAAVNDAKGRVEQAVQEETQNMMGGMKLPPGFKLPF